MKAAIFTLDTESYKARKASAAGMVLKKLLEQSGFETAAVRVIPKDRKVAASVLKRVAEEQTAELVLNCSAAGVCKKTLMVNLPGDAKEAKEALEFILPELKRAIEMLNV